MEKRVKEILLRYFIGMIIAIVTLFVPVFYFIFRPLTIWPTVFILGLFYEISLENSISIIVNGIAIEFIDACIAGSAFFLLFILNILTCGLSLGKRVYVFLFDAAFLLVMNIIRLILLIILLVNESLAFDITHKVFWYGISTVFVVLVWILTVFIFKIKTIPFISDIKFILNKSSFRK